MSSLSRAMGKALSAGAPIMVKKWEADMQAAEEARMREWQSGEYAANREQAASIHADNLQMDKSQLAVTEKGVDADIRQGDARIAQEGEALGLTRERQNKALLLLDQQITAATNENTDTSELRRLRTEYINADPADTDKIQKLERALQAQGIEIGEEYDYHEVDSYNEYGEKNGEEIFKSTKGGRVERVDLSGGGGGGGAPQFKTRAEAKAAAKLRYPNADDATLEAAISKNFPNLR